MQQSEFDYIIVGGGTAGCILASRLTENEALRVLLIETGHAVNHLSLITDPVQFVSIIGSDYDWQYPGYPGGKILGGSSKINASIFIHGTAKDYETWPRGWQYDDLLPYFKKIENCEDLPSDAITHNKENRGFHGPIKLMLAGNNCYDLHPYTIRFLESCVALGYKHIGDINNRSREQAASLHQFNINNHQRQSVDICYLADRKNLTIKSNTSVTSIIIENHQATGVLTDKSESFKANKEIILSAGAIGTPKILMLSGIGKKEDLNALGITCVSDLPVGDYFQDHIATPMIFATNKACSHYIPNCIDSGVQASLFTQHIHDDTKQYPNIQLSFSINTIISKYKNTPLFSKLSENHHGFAILPAIGIPLSHGQVTLPSNDAQALPVIKFNPYESKHDKETMLSAMKIARRIANGTVFAEFDLHEMIDDEIPHDPQSDDYLLAYMEKYFFSQAHGTGTCAMDKVVDDALKVKGVENLRVVDASVFPQMINVNIQSTVMAVAEKASMLILASYKA